MTPSIAIVQIETGHWWGIPIVVPLFLLWIPVILLSPLILLVLSAACFLWRVSFWRAISTFCSIVSSLPGTDVRVCADGNRVMVRIL
jgi:hypothetical protein